MSAAEPLREDDSLDFRESLQADADTLAARGFASNFCAGWLALWRFVLVEYGERLEEAYLLTFPDKPPKTAAQIVASCSRTVMALISAAVRADKSKSQRRRFKCASWMLESYRAGLVLLPDEMPADEKKKRRANLSRYWRTRWAVLHMLQCVTQLPLVTREAKDWRDNRNSHDAAHYTEQATELLFDIMGRGRFQKGVSRVRVFELAVESGVESFRKRFGPYAPGYQLPTPAPEPEGDAPGKRRERAKVIDFDKAKEKLAGAVEILRARAEAGKLTPEEADEFLRLLAPVVEIARATSAKEGVVTSADFEAAESNATFEEATCDFSAKNEDSESVSADVFIRREYTPLGVPPWEFLRAFYPDPHEEVRLRVFKPKKAPDGEPRFTARIISSRRAKLATDERHVEELRKLNASRGLYFTVNAGGDEATEITRVNAFFAEADTLPIPEQHANADACPLPPSIRVETKSSVHLHWPAAPGVTLEEFDEIQRRLIHYFKSDPKIKDRSRVMRLPGFNHVTFEAGGFLTFKPVEVVAFDPERKFTAAEMLAAFPAVPDEKPRRPPRVKSLGELTGDFEAYKRELGARIAAHRTARRNGAGNWDCQALCHSGKGSTGLFYSPKTNVIHCNHEPSCDLSTIAARFGMPPYSAARALDGRAGKGRDMTEAERIIEECAARGVVLTIDESSDALAFDAPAGALTPELRAALVAHKADVIQILFEREERAALMDVEEWVDASLLSRAMSDPATLHLLEAFARCGVSIVSAAPTRERREKAA